MILCSETALQWPLSLLPMTRTASCPVLSLGALGSCLMWLRISGTCIDTGPAFQIWTVLGPAASTESLSWKYNLKAGMTWLRWNINSGSRMGAWLNSLLPRVNEESQLWTMFFLLPWSQVMCLVSEPNHEKFHTEIIAGPELPSVVFRQKLALFLLSSLFFPSYRLLLWALFGRKIVLSKGMWNILDVLHWGYV